MDAGRARLRASLEANESNQDRAMATRSKLTVILHADVVGSTALVQKDERIAHERIRDAFQQFSKIIVRYGGIAHEIRGDACRRIFESF